MNKNYYIGLDIGSDSVGWAVTDENYNLLRLKGKTAWGARLFDSAEDSKARRGFRSLRRRQTRRKYRINSLNELFKDQISKVDDTFLYRLGESNLISDEFDENGNLIKGDKKYSKYPLFLNKIDEKIFIRNIQQFII